MALIRRPHNAETAVIALVDITGRTPSARRVATWLWPDARQMVVTEPPMEGPGASAAIRSGVVEGAFVAVVARRLLTRVVAPVTIRRYEAPSFQALTGVAVGLHGAEPIRVAPLNASLQVPMFIFERNAEDGRAKGYPMAGVAAGSAPPQA